MQIYLIERHGDLSSTIADYVALIPNEYGRIIDKISEMISIKLGYNYYCKILACMSSIIFVKSELVRMKFSERPVFFSESRRRARIMNAALLLIASLTSAGFAVLVYGIFVAPILPASITSKSSANTAKIDLASTILSDVEAVNPSSNRQLPAAAAATSRLAYVTGNSTSIASLEQHAGELDGIIPDWLALRREDGRVRLAFDGGSMDLSRWLKTHAPHLKIYPILNVAVSNRDTMMTVSVDAERMRIIDEICQYLKDNDLSGLTLSITDEILANQRIFAKFILELKERLSERQRTLIIMASLSSDATRIAELSRAFDYVLVRTHDGVRDGRPSPIAPQGWIETRLDALFARIDARKVMVGIGSLGVDWNSSGRMRQISVSTAWTLLDRAGAQLEFDQRSLNPTFRYHDKNGQSHEVWLLDGVTSFNQLRAALSHRPAALVLWPLGSEDPGLWSMWARTKLPDAQALHALETMLPGRDLFANLDAALVSAGPGNEGRRMLAYNERLGLITGQAIAAVPHQARISTLSPVAENLVALTFDDGPDERYTARILDALQEKQAKATFYVIGRNALQSPGLVKRIYDEGHDIGNHTFSHPRLMESGRDRIGIELNLAQRVIEAETGARTTLFRPPEAYTSLAYLDESQHLVELASELGYQIGAIDIDSFDWAAPQFPGVSKARLVDRVVEQVVNGRGRIILMHDAGGNRQLTVDALPDIIDRLHAKGFRFVTTHELVGQPREAVMPPVRGLSLAETMNSQVWRVGPPSIAWLSVAIPAFAIVTTLLAMFRLTMIIVGATLHRLRGGPSNPPTEWQPRGIAVLVPAYNEDIVIEKTLRTLLASTVAEKIEILVIDDGSTDGTLAAIQRAFPDDRRIRVHSKPNGGKASALNAGLQLTSAEIVVAIDGDTVLLPDAIERLVRHFADPAVGAVAGTVLVGNQNTLIGRFQALEYVMSQSLDRRAFELINAIGVVPGAIGAWRRKAVVDVGGYSSATLAEDADLTVSLELAGWKVVCEPNARALTEAPERLRAFLKQRFRWMFGTLQVAFKHAPAGLRRLRGASLFLLLNVILFQFCFTLIAPLMDAILLYSVATSLVDIALLGAAGQGDKTIEMLIYCWVIFQVFDFFAGAAALILHGSSRDWRLIALLVIQRFSYRQLLYIIAIRTLLTACKGSFVGWGKLIRTGSVDPTVASAHVL